MRLIFAPLATADLEEIGDYIALDNPPRALSFIRELRAQCRKILDNPLAFPARKDATLALALPFKRPAGIKPKWFSSPIAPGGNRGTRGE